MALYKRIGTVALQYGSGLVADCSDRERETVVQYISKAGNMGIDILLFQEIYGFTTHDVDSDPGRKEFAPGRDTIQVPAKKSYADLAISLDDSYVQRVREEAKRAGVNVILPLLERNGQTVHNSLVPVTDEGKLLRPYRKMFPVAGSKGEIGEGGHACPGESNEAQTISGIPVSFAICFDLHFDEVFTAARESGAKLMLWSSMWMGGLWLCAQAIRNGFYIVSATPDGCTFVDMDGTTIAESHTAWPQTVGQNNLIFEDMNFDREIFHCAAEGKLNAIRSRYGSKVHTRNRPQDSIVIIESLDPDLSIDSIKQEFELVPWYDYIQISKSVRQKALDRWNTA